MRTWCQALSSGGKSNSAPVPCFCFVAAPRWWLLPLRDGGWFNWLKPSLLWMSCSYWRWRWWPRRGDRDCGEPSASSSSSPQLSEGLTNRSRRFRLDSKRCKNLRYKSSINERSLQSSRADHVASTLPPTPNSVHSITPYSSAPTLLSSSMPYPCIHTHPFNLTLPFT